MTIKKNKRRLEAIRNILREELICSQDEVLHHLRNAGIEITQSTLSRDFKRLNVVRTLHPERGYIYVPGEDIAETATIQSNLDVAIESIRFSGNNCVIITKAGYAGAVANTIDSLKVNDILGSVAGANTIILVLTEDCDHNRLLTRLSRTFPTVGKNDEE